ncbi:MAG: oligosaccharide flippase family protein [Proteobacteria bacterium]|nr:oligosaccharide flippase family protein [Pseudomonadota bacterium]
MAVRVVSRAIALGSLTAAGQLLVIGTLPLYSRQFDPGAYGEYVIFVGITAVISVFAGLRYDSAIVLPRQAMIAQALSSLVMAITLVVASGIALLAIIAPALLSGEASQVGRSFGLALAAATLVGAVQRCLTSWCVRDSRFLSIGVGQFTFALMTVVMQLLLVRVMPQLPALVWGYVGALVAQSLCLAFPAHLPGHWLRGASLRGMRIAAARYRRFPTYMVGYALASSVRDRLIQIMLGLGAGAAAVGRFGLAYRVAFAPNSLIYSAVSPIFYSIASRGTREAVGRIAGALVETMFVALVVPYTAFAIEAPGLTDELLSEKWHGTGPYLRALAAPALMLAATCWLDRAFDSFRRQHAGFALEASFTLVSVVTVGVLAQFLDPVSVTWAFAALGLIYYWVYFLTTFIACGFPLADFRRACGSGLGVLSVAVAGAATVHQAHLAVARVAGYGFLMTVVLAGWLRLRGGTAILRSLAQLHVGDPSAGQQRQRG